MRHILLLINFVFAIDIWAQPFFGIPEQNLASAKPCSTENKFSPPTNLPDDIINNPLQYSKTRVTFYGDSRVDLMNALPEGTDPVAYLIPFTNGRYPGFSFYLGTFYGMASLDYYLGIDDVSWNVQNFAKSGMNSEQLLTYLTNCLDKPTHAIASNVAFEIGGNDYLQNLHFLIFMPWETENYVSRSMNNIEKIVTRFYKRRKNVLVIGNYATISYSFFFGVPKDGKFAFESLNFDYVASLALTGVVNQDKFKNFFSTVGDLLANLPNIISPTAFPSGDPLCAGGPPGIAGVYFCWLQTNFKAPTSMASLAMGFQEQRYAEMIARRQPYFASNQLTLYYASPWHLFQSIETPEPYVVNHNLMGDLIHPNSSGMAVWGNFISNKIGALGWKTIPTPPATPVTPPSAPTDDGGEVITNPPAGPDPLTLLLLCYLAGICH